MKSFSNLKAGPDASEWMYSTRFPCPDMDVNS